MSKKVNPVGIFVIHVYQSMFEIFGSYHIINKCYILMNVCRSEKKCNDEC